MPLLVVILLGDVSRYLSFLGSIVHYFRHRRSLGITCLSEVNALEGPAIVLSRPAGANLSNLPHPRYHSHTGDGMVVE